MDKSYAQRLMLIYKWNDLIWSVFKRLFNDKDKTVFFILKCLRIILKTIVAQYASSILSVLFNI